ncbi:MarR family winged helix-turn-helix transcriptional regulator [Microbulbifer sp. ANSA002]|uniref:MarR family winged helix-turn-helix transcriptional regulator n=1 Tax=unclassified Microbulbifer TaxID=2619833 RepID=UPI0040413AE8
MPQRREILYNHLYKHLYKFNTMKYSQLGTRLRHLIELLDGDVADSYRTCGIKNYKPRYTPVMRALIHKSPVTINEIAASAAITQPAVSQTIRDMVQQGLLEILTGEDARQRKVRLSRKGQRLLPKLEVHWQATVEAERSLNRQLSTPLTALVEEAITALQEHPYLDRIQQCIAKENKKP